MGEEKSFFEDFKTEKPESFEEEVFVKTKSRKPMYFGFLLIACIVLFLGINQLNKVEVPDMSTWSVADVNGWTKKNNVTLIGKQVFDNVIEKDMVVLQIDKAGETIKKKDSVEVTFSKGANPDAAIDFPDMKLMTSEEIKTFVKEKKLTGVNIQYENSESIEKGTVISIKFVDGDQSSFVRKNRVKLVISNGTTELTDTLSMPDLYGKSKQEVEKWATDNKVRVVTEESYNDSVATNLVISQNVTKNTKFNRDDTITVVISKGAAIHVPDFTGLTSAEATNLAGLYEVRLFIRSIESSGEEDRILSQDIDKGTEVEKNVIITLHVSKASNKIVVPSLVGLSKTQAAEVIAYHGIKVIYQSVESTEKELVILSQSIEAGSKVDDKAILVLTVSDLSIVMPDFTNMNKAEAVAQAESLGLKVLITEKVYIHKKNDTVIGQDILPGGVVKSDSRIIFEVAVNNGVKIVDLTWMSKVDAEFWAKSKGANIRIIDTYSNTVEKGTLYDQNFVDFYLPADEPVVIYHSLGKIQVSNFIGRTKNDVETWVESLNENGANITVSYINVTSSSYSKGEITSHTPLNKSVEIGSKIVFYVCSAQENNTVTLPSFTGLSESEFVNWCNNNGVSYNINETYNNTISEGTVYGQNTTVLDSKASIVTVTKSLGQIPVVDFTDKTKTELLAWLQNVNSKGGNLAISYLTQAGGTVDNVAVQSVTTGTLLVGATLTITLSTGL